MELGDIDSRLRQTVDNIEKYGREYASARGLSWLLQEQKRCILATQILKAGGKTVLEKESIALASEKYKTHLNVTKDCIAEELSLKATYERWQAEFEALRSLMSLEKTKMNLV